MHPPFEDAEREQRHRKAEDEEDHGDGAGTERAVLEHHRHVALGRGEPGNVAPADPHPASRGGVETGDDPQQRGLAAARRAEQARKLPSGAVSVTPSRTVTGPKRRVTASSSIIRTSGVL